jgi:tight adherence protein B
MPTLPILIIAIGMLGALFVLYSAMAGPSPAKAQARRLDGVRERHSKSNEVAAQAQLKRILATRGGKMDGVAQKFIPNPALLRQRIERTGRSWTLAQYLMVCVTLALVIAMLLLINGLPILLAVFIGLFAGIALPHFTVSFLIKRRIAKFTVRFPDALELMVRGLRSGLPISETIGIVATEIPGPIQVEFQAVSDKMKIGRTMEVALQETADRLGTPEFQFFVITLAIQRETGGNLAETLANLADVLRKRAQMKLKIKAMSSESKASAYIIGSLPFIVFGLIYSINPKYMGDFFVDQRLMIAGISGIFWMAIGAGIMAKMINFEI